ncbi:hypothetical protein T439DRAFT_358664 [Meredithblackwellia eburnea MCA 4105]
MTSFYRQLKKAIGQQVGLTWSDAVAMATHVRLEKEAIEAAFEAESVDITGLTLQYSYIDATIRMIMDRNERLDSENHKTSANAKSFEIPQTQLYACQLASSDFVDTVNLESDRVAILNELTGLKDPIGKLYRGWAMEIKFRQVYWSNKREKLEHKIGSSCDPNKAAHLAWLITESEQAEKEENMIQNALTQAQNAGGDHLSSDSLTATLHKFALEIQDHIRGLMDLMRKHKNNNKELHDDLRDALEFAKKRAVEAKEALEKEKNPVTLNPESERVVQKAVKALLDLEWSGVHIRRPFGRQNVQGQSIDQHIKTFSASSETVADLKEWKH